MSSEHSCTALPKNPDDLAKIETGINQVRKVVDALVALYEKVIREFEDRCLRASVMEDFFGFPSLRPEEPVVPCILQTWNEQVKVFDEGLGRILPYMPRQTAEWIVDELRQVLNDLTISPFETYRETLTTDDMTALNRQRSRRDLKMRFLRRDLAFWKAIENSIQSLEKELSLAIRSGSVREGVVPELRDIWHHFTPTEQDLLLRIWQNRRPEGFSANDLFPMMAWERSPDPDKNLRVHLTHIKKKFAKAHWKYPLKRLSGKIFWLDTSR